MIGIFVIDLNHGMSAQQRPGSMKLEMARAAPCDLSTLLSPFW